MEKDIVINLVELAKKRHMTLRKLARLCNIRAATIHELANMKRQNINLYHIKRIAEALGISDIREIITIVDAKKK